MRLRIGRQQEGTRYSVGRLPRGIGWGVFRTLPLPGRGVVRIMDKCLHMAALESAGRKLDELGYKSGKPGRGR